MAGGKISKLRRGIRPYRRVTLGNGDNSLDVIVVLLSADDMQEIEELTEQYCQNNKDRINQKVRRKYYNKLLCHYCMMDPDDSTFTTPITESPDEVGENMDEEDINRICQAYSELLINKAPKLEMLKKEEFEELKKHLEVTPLSDLSTVSLAHLVNFHRTIVSER